MIDVNSRIRKNYAAENFAMMRHIALNLLKQEQSNKYSLKKKRYVATLNPDTWKKYYRKHNSICACPGLKAKKTYLLRFS